MEHLLKGFEWWSAYDYWSGGIIICARESVVLATQCTSAPLNSDGRIASAVLRGSNTYFLLVGTYWPSGSSDDALACRNEMQVQIVSLINSHSDCTPLIYSDMNATACNNDRAGGIMYLSDRSYRSFLSSNNLSPRTENSTRPWTHYQATARDYNENTTYTFSCIDDIILPSDLATQCPPCHTCELGYLSDNIPLLMTLPTSILDDIQPPKSCPLKVLHRPVNDIDQLTFMQSLLDPANGHGVVQELEDTLNTLDPAPEEAIAFLRNSNDKNARNSSRLYSLCIRPATEAVVDMARSVANIIHSSYHVALKACSTKTASSDHNHCM